LHVDQDPISNSNLHRWVKSAIRSLIVSAIAVAVLCFSEPQDVRPAFAALSSFTPSTMMHLIKDANAGCERGGGTSARPAAMDFGRGLDGLKLTHGLSDTRYAMPCTTPLIDGWPAAGLWVPRLQAALGLPTIPVLGFLFALVDVTFHLMVPTTVKSSESKRTVVAFTGLLQVVLGFGLTVLALKPISKWLNDGWLAVLIFLGTLFVGSAISWVVAEIVTRIFAGAERLMANPWLATIIACGATYAVGVSLVKGLLEKQLDRRLDQPVDRLAEKTARWFIKYAP
jgi:hypothetical protein